MHNRPPSRPPSKKNNNKPQSTKPKTAKPQNEKPSSQQNYRRHIRPSSVQAQRIAAKRRRRKKQWLRLLLIVLALVILVFVVLGMFTLADSVITSLQNSQSAASTSVSTPVSVSAPPPVSSSSSVSVSVPSIEIPAAVGELDVEGIPPLYNFENPIPQEVYDNLDLAPAGYLEMEPQAAAAFNEMQAAAAADGVTLTPVSGYRTNDRQTTNYNNSIQNYLASGYSEEEAVRLTELYYAIPGTSEHEAGLAMDIGVVDDSFANTPAYAWLQENCTKYGFIYRYKQGETDITHINWEPWHYRFIGVNHALEYERLGMNTLEEYVAYLEGA